MSIYGILLTLNLTEYLGNLKQQNSLIVQPKRLIIKQEQIDLRRQFDK